MITFSQLGNPSWGRLGNQLFQIASTIGIATKNKQGFGFSPWEYASFFENRLPAAKEFEFSIYKEHSIHYHDVLLPEGDWDLRGFFPTEKYFLPVEQLIRHYFQPANETKIYIEKKYGSLLNENSCSIHVRRGDFLKYRYSFPPQPLKFYRKAIDLFSPETTFLIFSDDISWCKNQFKGERFFFVEGERDIIDLFVMSKCRNHIISNSTFSWWGAWLNPSTTKRVICPEHWFGAEAAINSDLRAKDIYAGNFEKLPLHHGIIYKISYRLYNIILFLLLRTYRSLILLAKKIKRLFFK